MMNNEITLKIIPLLIGICTSMIIIKYKESKNLVILRLLGIIPIIYVLLHLLAGNLVGQEKVTYQLIFIMAVAIIGINLLLSLILYIAKRIKTPKMEI